MTLEHWRLNMRRCTNRSPEIYARMRGAIAASSFPVGASRSNNESETLIQIIREKTIVKKKNDKLHSFSMYLSNVAMTSYCVASSLIKIFMILPP